MIWVWKLYFYTTNIEQENCLFSLCVDLSRDHISSTEMSPSTSFRCITHPTGSDLDNAQDLIEINPTKDNCFYQMHTDGIVSLDLDFKL